MKLRKSLPLFVVSILVLGGLGAVAVTNDDFEIETKTVVFSQPTIQSEEEFVTISVDEANTFLMEQGKPMLPSYTHTFTFPFGTKIKSVTCTPVNIHVQTTTKDVKPTPQAVVVGRKIASIQREAIDYGTETYPLNWFEYDVGCGLYNGVKSIILDVEVNPVRYHPQEKFIESVDEVDIEIRYEQPDPGEPQSSGADYQLIVIGPNEFSDEIAPLITHKTGRGITAKFVGLSEVYSGPGRDNQEKIKYYIKDAIENWATGNILLVGSSSKLPARTTHVYIEEEDPDPEIFVSDLYYADIYDEYGGFASWDSNGNNIFGELDWEGQTDTDVDLIPDVYLGRWACTSGSQVTTCVNKVKTYETTQAYQQAWFNNLVVVGGDTSPDYETVEGEYINQKVIDMMDGFIPEKLWVTNGVLTGWTPTGTAAIKNAINSGCGFVDFSGHGNTNVWATHPEESHDWVPTPLGWLLNVDILALTNGNKLPIVTVEACSTSKFNTDSNCFNWAFLRNSGGGGIGSFGATALGWGYTGTGIAQGLIGKMGLDTFRAYAEDDAVTYGEMWAKALDRYINPTMEPMDYKTVEEWEPFGDPTLVIGEESDPPLKPSRPNGPPSGSAGTEYTYTTSTTDPNGDKLYYMFDWDDGTTSGWVGSYNSGQTASAKKTWAKQGTYSVRVVAKDEHGKLSQWSDPLTVKMPKNVPNIQSVQQSPKVLSKLNILQCLLGFRGLPNVH